jgi:beta-N-acetylhexosaminidase
MRKVEQMTLEQKIGQLVMCGFEGTEPSEEVLRLIREKAIGGVIYFARNVRNVEQVVSLSAALQEAAAASGQEPLFIGIDQEGGMVARITDGVALMPGAMAIAAAGSLEEAYQAALICGQELKALGINLNYAPVLDVNNNAANPVIGVRSFGEDPAKVAEYGVKTLQGLQSAGVIATAKHFPGHGDTNVDSHLDLPTVPHARERIEQVELRPFREAIAAGVDSIMSSHVVFPAFESQKLPVTLSKAVLTGLLREELGYEGVIMTDCMEMNAIAEHFGTVEAAVMAVEAGADLVLISHSHDRQQGAINALLQAVRSGRLSEERINRSVNRLLALKEKRGLYEPAAAVEVKAVVGTAEHKAVARRISESSITLVKDEAGLLPFRTEDSLFLISIEGAVLTQVDEAVDAQLTLGSALRELGAQVTELVVPLTKVEELKKELLSAVRYERQVIIATYNAYLDPAQAELIRELLALGKEITVVAQRSPYDLLAFPAVSTYVVAYENRPLALRSTAKVLMGDSKARGKLPITLSEGETVMAGGGSQ